MHTYIGIDPGKHGGIGIIHRDGFVEARKLPQDTYLLVETMQLLARTDGRSHVVLERVSASPQMGVVSAFTFGEGVGRIRAALAAAGLRWVEVIPSQWQRVLDCRTKGDKNITKAKAQQLFPHIKVTHAIADGLLLAEYCRKVYSPIPNHRREHGKEGSEI